MKGLLILLILSTWVNADVEIRAYHVSKVELKKAFWKFENDTLPELGVVKKAGFRSRFFKKGGKKLSFAAPMKAILGEEFQGRAVYLPKKDLLVMQAEESDHEAFATVVHEDRPLSMRTTITVLKGAVDRDWPPFFVERPKGLWEASKVSFLSLPATYATARSSDRELKVEFEYQIHSEPYSEAQIVALSGDLAFGRGKKKVFSLPLCCTLPVGVRCLQPVGSQDGKEAYFLEMEMVLMVPSGKPLDDWIEKEVGGVFLQQQRLEALRLAANRCLFPPPIDSEAGVEVRQFTVAPTFLNFISNGEETIDDPFASEEQKARDPNNLIYLGEHPELKQWRKGKLMDIRTLLINNGLTFRKGDFAVYSPVANTVIAKLPFVQMEILDAIVGNGGPQPIQFIEVELKQREIGKKKKIKKIATVVVPPGQTGAVQPGRELRVEMEAQIGGYDSLIDLRFSLREGRGLKEILSTGLSVGNGEEMVVLGDMVNGKRREWVLKAKVIRVPEDLADVLAQ